MLEVPAGTTLSLIEPTHPWRNSAIITVRIMVMGAEVSAMSHERIEINPDVMMGKPVIRGTRITVESILRKLSAGMTPQEVADDHPNITADDIRAAQAFAADYLADEEVVFG